MASLTTHIVSDGAAQLVHSWSCLCNFLGSTDDIRRILQWPFPPGEKMVERSVTIADLLHPCVQSRSSTSVMWAFFGKVDFTTCYRQRLIVTYEKCSCLKKSQKCKTINKLTILLKAENLWHPWTKWGNLQMDYRKKKTTTSWYSEENRLRSM